MPAPLTRLVARGQELEALRLHLQRPNTRLLTLTGPSGIGKTRLAIEFAVTQPSAFPDGVVLVELAPLTEPSLVVQAVASALGVREQPGTPLLTSVSDTLKSHQLLLVLDSCEHLVGPCAELAESLLRTCRDLRILATSLEPLRISGEATLTVPPLAVPDPGRLPPVERLTDYDSARLFVERAQSVLPGFAVTAQNASSVARICQQLDGLPLALELAAAWVRTLNPEQIAARLEDRFRLLTGGSRTATRRHQTLRGAIEWSYSLLNADEQTLFNRLSVFMGGFSLDIAETVCTGDGIAEQEVLHLLDRLVDTSFMVVEELDGDRRYRLLETLRLYGRERLVTKGEAEAAYRRHAEHYVTLAEQAELALWGPDLVSWLDRLNVEHDNLRAALRWSTGRGEAEVALRLGAALSRFWQVHGHLSEGLQWLQSGLSWNSGTSSAIRARALDAAGHLARDREDFDQAWAFYEESLRLRHELEDERGAALALNNLGVVAQFQGDNARAVALHEESLALFRVLDDHRGVALSLLTLGSMAQLQGELERAAAHYEEGLALFKVLGDTRGIAASLNNLGNLASSRRDYPAADQCYAESAALFLKLGDTRDVAACLSNRAGVARDLGEHTRSAALAQKSLALFHELRDQRGIVSCLELLADIAVALKQPERSARFLAAAEALRETIGTSRSAVRSGQEHTITALRRMLGPDAFANAWEAGRAAPFDEILADALAAMDVVPAPESPATSHSSPLTRREREVAALIARGLTNRQIAEALFIAERTADTHVEHILTKLGLNSRAQVAAWVVEQREDSSGFRERAL